jgi:hypothetical protein
MVSSETCGTVTKDSILCSGKGFCDFQKCSCFSGYAGFDCEYEASATDCIWNTNSLTRTDFYAVPDNSKIFYHNNTIHITVKSPLVADRLNTKIYIEYNTEGCSYPGNFSMNVLDFDGPCYNLFNFSIPWELGKKCGWKITEYEEETVYYANMYIEQLENLGSMRGEPLQRFIKRVIPLKLSFKKKICVSTKIKVDSPFELYTAITNQEFDADPRKSIGKIDFITSLMYPIDIDPNDLNIVSFPLGLYPRIKEISNYTTCLNRESCTQKYSVSLAVDGACSFSGEYRFQFKFKCNPTITRDEICPLGDGDKLVNVVLDVNSEDFCSSLKVNVDIQGSIKAYQDDSYSTLKSIFHEKEISFFKVESKSSQASLMETNVIRVHVEQGNITIVLFDNSNITLDGIEANFKIGIPPTATSSIFQFDFKKFPLEIAPNYTQTLKVSALTRVKYQSTDGSTFFSYSNSSSILRSGDVVGKIENSQMTKFSGNIKLFKLYKPNNGIGFARFSKLIIFLFLVFIF